MIQQPFFRSHNKERSGDMEHCKVCSRVRSEVLILELSVVIRKKVGTGRGSGKNAGSK